MYNCFSISFGSVVGFGKDDASSPMSIKGCCKRENNVGMKRRGMLPNVFDVLQDVDGKYSVAFYAKPRNNITLHDRPFPFL